MKTSTIIAIALGIFIIGGLLTYFIDQKKYEVNEAKPNAIRKEIELPPFSVIVAEKGSDLHIEKSDINRLIVEYKKSKKEPSNFYRIAHDTLHLDKGYTVFVKGKNIRTIIGPKHYYLGIYKFISDSLNLKMKAEIFYRDSLYSGYKEFKEDLYRRGIYSKDSAYLEINKADLYNITFKADKAVVSLNNSENACTYNYEGKNYKNGGTNKKYNFSFEMKKMEKDSTALVKVSTW